MDTVKSLNQYKYLPIYPGCTVLDIGGHIGSFTRYALSRGAGRVVAYEPEPDNYRMLVINSEAKPVTAYNQAVTSDGRKVTLNVKTNGHTGGHSIVIDSKNRDHIIVPSVPFREAVESAQPEVIKIDCEGAEYEFNIPHAFTESVRAVTMEIHLGRKQFRQIEAPKLINDLDKWGKRLKLTNYTDKTWTVIGTWER